MFQAWHAATVIKQGQEAESEMETGNSKQDERYRRMTQTPVPQLIRELAVPTIISMLVTGIYNTADKYFVAQMPQDATPANAAVGLVFPMMAIIQAGGFFFGHGSGNFLSRMLGAGEKKKASEMASTGFALALILGALIAVLGNIFVRPMVTFLATEDVTETTLRMTAEYARIILLGAPFMMCQFVINNQLRFQGSAVYAMVGLLAGAIINIVLDPLLILLCGFGIKGAAIATISGQLMSFIILLIGSRHGENIRLHIRNVRINGYYIFQIVNGGAPSLFRQGLAAVSSILLNRASAQWGQEAAVAGMTNATTVLMLVVSALIGFGQGYQPVCSFNYGAGLKQRVKEGYFFCVKWGTIFLTVAAVIIFVYAPQIILLIRNDAAVAEVGGMALRAQSLALPLLGVSIMTNMMLQSIGSGLKASIASSARNGIFFIPAILILPRLFGLFGVEIAQAVADVVTLALSVPLAVSELCKM